MMNYSISKVSTAEGCDLLIDYAESFLEDLNFKKSEEEREYSMMTKVDSIVEANQSGINTEIIGYETTLEGMPDGICLDDMDNELEELYRKSSLNEYGRQAYGLLVVVQLELAIACLEKQMVETMGYINALRKRREEL